MYLLSIPLPLLWTVNIGMRRKLSLMLLFSGAIFVMMAGTIRAVVILSSGPEGAVTGSEWACRETFVAIVVANLPILQPLIRQGASKIGLSGLFSRTTKMGQSHPLGSQERNGDAYEIGNRRNSQSRQVSRNTRWGSTDHILRTETASGNPKLHATQASKDIVIAHEVSITHEMTHSKSAKGTDKGGELGHRSSARAVMK
ncbi:hypothetical protein TruAng_004295 [Truncatella angustata]|nr:hypothetical protein TruAng_004295 [Truncatella angustata]